MTSWLVAALAMVSAAAAWHAGPRRVDGLRRDAARRDQARLRSRPTPSRPHRPRVSTMGALARLTAPMTGRSQRGVDFALGRVLVEVAGRMRAGASSDAAWSAALARIDSAQVLRSAAPLTCSSRVVMRAPVPHRADLGGTPERLLTMPRSQTVDAAVVACRLAYGSGAPLADVLERCSAGVVESAAAARERRLALAGPAGTARLLGWLPAGMLAVGAAMGADPLGVLLGGGAGTVCLIAGAAFTVAGRRWIRSLVRAAEAEPWTAPVRQRRALGRGT